MALIQLDAAQGPETTPVILAASHVSRVELGRCFFLDVSISKREIVRITGVLDLVLTVWKA